MHASIYVSMCLHAQKPDTHCLHDTHLNTLHIRASITQVSSLSPPLFFLFYVFHIHLERGLGQRGRKDFIEFELLVLHHADLLAVGPSFYAIDDGIWESEAVQRLHVANTQRIVSARVSKMLFSAMQESP